MHQRRRVRLHPESAGLNKAAFRQLTSVGAGRLRRLRGLGLRRFWRWRLRCGLCRRLRRGCRLGGRRLDGFRLDTVNFYFHDARLPDDPADPRKRDTPANRPYDLQYHLHSQNQAENLGFLSRMRALLDEYVEPKLDAGVNDELLDYIARREREIPAADALNQDL